MLKWPHVWVVLPSCILVSSCCYEMRCIGAGLSLVPTEDSRIVSLDEVRLEYEGEFYPGDCQSGGNVPFVCDTWTFDVPMDGGVHRATLHAVHAPTLTDVREDFTFEATDDGPCCPAAAFVQLELAVSGAE